MITEVRQKAILEYIVAKGEASVQQLSRMYDVSDMTIRRDLLKMEQAGLIKRTYGGAIATANNVETSVAIRATEHLDKKIAIAEACVRLIQPNDTILMDAGTTIMEVARRLPQDLGITVITNAMTVVNALLDKPGIELMILGGPFQHTPQVTVGSNVIESIKSLNVSRTFITATGFSLEYGLTDANILQSEVKRHMMTRAKVRTLVIDSSKYGLLSLHRFADLQDFDEIVTDNQLDANIIEQIRSEKVGLFLAELNRKDG